MAEIKLSDLARKLEQLEQEKSDLNDQLKAKQKNIDLLRERILAIMNLREEKSTHVEGVGRFVRVTRRFANVKDWDKFYEYIIEKGLVSSLLQRRVSSTTTLEMMDNGEEIPGVEVSSAHAVRFTRDKK